MTNQMVIRLEPELKRKVNELAKAEGKNISQVVRELMMQYVRDRDISGYIDDLWARIGTKLRNRAMTPEDIERIIGEVRRNESDPSSH